MGVKVRCKTNNKIPKLTNTMKSLNGKKVQIGAINGSHAWLAGIHEYGCNIPVTDKMRAFLHSKGLHLKESTKVIKIPERAFLRTGHDQNAKRIMKQTEQCVALVVSGKMTVDRMLDICGEQFVTAIKKYMTDLKSPKNHPYTVEQKGSSNPLIDTGNLLECIDWKVE